MPTTPDTPVVPTVPDTTEALHVALIDWIVAHGHPLGTFGPGGTITTNQKRADLAQRGINYAASVVGDLGGQEWSHDTFDETTTHPGLWADITGTCSEDHGRWFVPGNQHTLTDIILDILTATG